MVDLLPVSITSWSTRCPFLPLVIIASQFALHCTHIWKQYKHNWHILFNLSNLCLTSMTIQFESKTGECAVINLEKDHAWRIHKLYTVMFISVLRNNLACTLNKWREIYHSWTNDTPFTVPEQMTRHLPFLNKWIDINLALTNRSYTCNG